MNWPRWKLKDLVIAIAALAVSFSVAGVAGTVFVFFLFLPAAFAPKGRRLAALYWVAASDPLLILLSFYVTWLAAWCALGRPPRPSLDDPKDIGPIVVPYVLSDILIFGSSLALIAGLGLAIARVLRRTIANEGGVYSAFLLGVVPTSWAVGFCFFYWDPIHVVDWFID